VEYRLPKKTSICFRNASANGPVFVCPVVRMIATKEQRFFEPVHIKTYQRTLLLSLACLCVGVNILHGPLNNFGDHRLLPLFMMRDGIPVYTDLSTGPAFSTMYPPLAELFYAPALLARTPMQALYFAQAVVEVLVFVPLAAALWLFRNRYSHGYSAIVGFSLFVLWCNCSEVMKSVHLIHADAPALFLSAFSWASFCYWLTGNKSRWFFVSALCAALAPWAKQVSAPVFLFPVIVLLASRRVKDAVRYGAVVAACEVLAVLAAAGLSDIRKMYFWIIVLPSKQHWKTVWSTALESANNELIVHVIPYIAVVAVGVAILVRRPRGQRFDTLVAAHPWMGAALCGLLLWPTSVLGYVKIGGAGNTLLYTCYFLAIAAALAFVELLSSVPDALWTRVGTAAFVLGIAMALPTAIAATKDVLHPARLTGATEEVFRYSKAHPGQVYFPWHPLAVYFAEHKLYHFELGIADRVAAGVPFDSDLFRRNIPPHASLVAYKGSPCEQVLQRVANPRMVQPPQGLPGWVVFQYDAADSPTAQSVAARHY
jgi:hypothetical protein